MLPCWRLLPFWLLLQVPSHIVRTLLPPTTLLTACPHEEEALTIWKYVSGSVPPMGKARGIQRAWDRPVACVATSNHMSGATPIARARLLASQQKEAGAWLTAPPLSALGLQMDNNSIHVGVGLCQPSAFHMTILCVAPRWIRPGYML